MLQSHREKTTIFSPLIKVFLSILLYVLFAQNSFAQEKITVSGNERVEESTIVQYFENFKIDKNIQKNIEIIKKNLLETELFSSVKIFQKNKIIVVQVIENPIIYETKFIGNKKIDEEVLISEISLKKRGVFSRSRLEGDIKRINEIYVKSGRFLTQIEPKIIPKDKNRIELIYEINEGPKANIGEIYFIGNKEFPDRELSEQISTKKSVWWKFLSSSDIYDSDRIEFDKEILRKFYNNNGFADFTTISALAQINRNKDNFFITFLVEEGIKYKIGEVTIDNRLEKFDPEILYKNILFKTGQIYNAESIENTIDKMVEIMSEKSYAFANIEPVLKRDRDKKTIDIEFIINETPRIFIDQIKIFGNTRTIDEVIRRELRIREGDPYNVNKINRSKQRIENLGFFEKVEFETKRIGDTDRVDLEITVKEKRTGELSLGVGYSTRDRENINAGIRENNLFGTGRKLGLNAQKSYTQLSADLSYTKPYFLGRPIDAGFEVFKLNSTKRQSRMYESNNSGLRLNASYSITEFLDHLVSYSYNNQKIGNIDVGASFATQSLQGAYVYSTLEQSITFDKTNNRINRKKGYFLSISQTFTGLGGNVKNLKHEGRAGYFVPTFNNDFILKFLARGGVIDGIGEDVRSQNNFFVGGNNFRGFQFWGIGPRAKPSATNNGSDEALGGKIYYVGTAEFTFPLGLPRELGVSGALFSDNGVLKSVDSSIKNKTDVNDTGSLRSSIGVSISWASPVGPIRLDFAKILRKESYDKSQTFNFNLGTSF
jgi:outer membrane protein insertion porin family